MMNLSRKLAFTVLIALLACTLSGAADITHPITPADLVTPSQLNSQLAEVKAGKTILIQVGFRMMYRMGHIPDSQYAGPAAKADGLDALKKLVAKLPRNQKIVIYCGCCPWDDCPNIRPAFQALSDMGFTNLKVLNIPDRLGTDWTARGYPTVKGE